MIQSNKIKPVHFELVIRCPECGWQEGAMDDSFESSGNFPCPQCDCRLDEDDVAVSNSHPFAVPRSGQRR